jgi:hypothetical protein
MAKDSSKANETPRPSIKNADIVTAAVSSMEPKNFEQGYERNEGEMLGNMGRNSKKVK